MTAADLHDELRALLHHVRRRWTRVVGLRAAARGSGAAAFILAAVAVIDRAIRLDGLLLVLLMGAGIVLAAVAVAVAVWTMPPRPTDRQVARFVEERTCGLDGPNLNDSLVSAVDAAERSAESQPMFVGLILLIGYPAMVTVLAL